MSKRLLKLQALVENGAQDPFVFYGLAMEYRSLERWDDALETFTRLRAEHPEYLPMYLICGQLLETRGDAAGAREWLEQGLAIATRTGDSKARHEIAEALDALIG